MGTGKATKSISCPFCGGKITVTFWWDTGYNKRSSGVGLPPSADMDFEQESCDCEQTEEWVRKVGEKFHEMREEEQRRKQEIKSREQILAEESGENGTSSKEYYRKHCIRDRGGHDE